MPTNLNRYATVCLQKSVESGHITPDSSYRSLLYDVSRSWRRQADATSFRADGARYSQRHIAGADVIIDELLCLQRDGCENIEMLLRERIFQRFGIV